MFDNQILLLYTFNIQRGLLMKKLFIALIVMIVILLIFILFQIFMTSFPKYTNEEIISLILKGVENLDDMSNVSYEVKSQDIMFISSYKGNKQKMKILYSKRPTSISFTITDLDKQKQYGINEEKKLIVVINQKYFSNIVQYDVLHKLNFVKPGNSIKFEYKYLKDDIIDGKDCILVEEETYELEDDTYINLNKEIPEKEVYFYWIEKSTGFIIATASSLPGNINITPEITISNITFGNVQDSDFNLPTDYQILETD